MVIEEKFKIPIFKSDIYILSFPSGSVVKIHLPRQKTQVQSQCREDPLEKEMATSILAWEIPWTEEPGGL